MSEYARVARRFWSSRTVRSLSEDARVLFLYSLTSPHANMLGCYILRPGYAIDDLQWEQDIWEDPGAFVETLSKRFPKRFVERFAKRLPKRFGKGLLELLTVTKTDGTQGLVDYDPVNEVIWIKNHHEWNELQNPNQVTGAIKKVEEMPDTPLFLLVAEYLETFLEVKPFLEPLVERLHKPFRNGLANGFETVTPTLSEPFANGLETVAETSIQNTVNSKELDKGEEVSKEVQLKKPADEPADGRAPSEEEKTEAADPTKGLSKEKEPEVSSSKEKATKKPARKKKTKPAKIERDLPTLQDIQTASMAQVEVWTDEICDALAEQEKFTRKEVHQFRVLMLGRGTNPRALLHALIRTFNAEDIDDGWGYALAITKIEDGNYNEKRHR